MEFLWTLLLIHVLFQEGTVTNPASWLVLSKNKGCCLFCLILSLFGVPWVFDLCVFLYRVYKRIRYRQSFLSFSFTRHEFFGCHLSAYFGNWRNIHVKFSFLVYRATHFLATWLIVAYLILNEEIYSYACHFSQAVSKFYYGKFTTNNIVARMLRIFVPCDCSRFKDGFFSFLLLILPIWWPSVIPRWGHLSKIFASGPGNY